MWLSYSTFDDRDLFGYDICVISDDDTVIWTVGLAFCLGRVGDWDGHELLVSMRGMIVVRLLMSGYVVVYDLSTNCVAGD